MAESSTQEKTEKATPKRKKDSRKKGILPRSREVVSFLLLVLCAGMLFLFGASLYDKFRKILVQGFILHPSQIHNNNLLFMKVKSMVYESFLLFSPFFILSITGVYLGNVLLSGHAFSIEKLKPKLSNINPVEGLKKLFSFNGFSNLLQTLFRAVLLGIVTVLTLLGLYKTFFLLPLVSIKTAIHLFAKGALFAFLMIAISTIIIALLDIFFQIYQYQKQIKMTKQEIKDELKQTETRPEIKRNIRRLQQVAAKNRKMLEELSKASALIINPTHFAVALYYDENSYSAPIILAKGANLVAWNIQKICTENKVPVLRISLLARALYYNGEIGKEIPEELFHAVAKVLAYIFSLDNPLSFHLDQEWIDQLPIPEELTRGHKQGYGRRQTG